MLLVAAAGLGTRLGSAQPKLLTPVAGRPMIDRILDRHAPHCTAAVVVVHPSARGDVERHLEGAPVETTIAIQSAPTGMLDALLVAAGAIGSSPAARVWITWCDQVAISSHTVDRLAAMDAGAEAAAAVFPTVTQRPPYIHFDRDDRGHLLGVRQRREGDVMPAEGESDAGLFSLSRDAFLTDLAVFAAGAERGAATHERNFLPFLPWLARRARVETFPIAAIEALGVNTAEDLARVEAHLRAAQAGA